MATPTVLVVDDNEPIRVMLVAALEQEGYSTLQAWDHASVHAALAEQPDLVLLNVHVRSLAVATVYRQVRDDVQTAAFPIIGMAVPGEGQDDLTADDWLVKPFHMTALYEIVARWTTKL